MARAKWQTGCLLMMACFLFGSMGRTYAAEAEGSPSALPPAASDAVKAAFPGAAIAGIEREREGGVTLYEVSLTVDGQLIEVEVSPEGIIGEIESALSLRDVPEDIADSIVKATKGGEIALIERHERRGAVESGRWVKLERPQVMYEVRYSLDGTRRRIVLTSDEAMTAAPLPQEARAAIQKAFPEATVEEVELEHELGLTLYDVEIRHQGREMEVKVAPDGTIVEVEAAVTTKDLPEAVASAIAKLADGGRVVELEEQRVYAVARLVELDAPQTAYEAEIVRDGEKLEVRVAPDGRVLEMESEDDGDDDNEEDDDDD